MKRKGKTRWQNWFPGTPGKRTRAETGFSLSPNEDNSSNHHAEFDAFLVQLVADVDDFGNSDSVRITGVEYSKQVIVFFLIQGKLDFVGRNLEELFLTGASGFHLHAHGF